MINPQLLTFIEVVDCGSFNKASEKLYLSSTAIMKQMNSLEQHFGFKLIDRKKNGISLTPSGKVIYERAKTLIEFSKETINEALAKNYDYDTTFCVGTSLLNPAKPFIDLWYRVNDKFKDHRLHLVPFDDDKDGIIKQLGLLGEKFDFIVGVCDSKIWKSICNYVPLGTYRLMIAVSRNNPLSSKRLISLDDLRGSTLVMVDKGDSGVNDYLRNEIETSYPDIKIENAGQSYDLSTFSNVAESNDKVLLTAECWKDVHPALVTIPVDWDYEIPYGLLYGVNQPDDVVNFVEEIKKMISR